MPHGMNGRGALCWLARETFGIILRACSCLDLQDAGIGQAPGS